MDPVSKLETILWTIISTVEAKERSSRWKPCVTEASNVRTGKTRPTRFVLTTLKGNEGLQEAVVANRSVKMAGNVAQGRTSAFAVIFGLGTDVKRPFASHPVVTEEHALGTTSVFVLQGGRDLTARNPHAPLPVPMGEHAEMIRVYVPADGLEIFVKHLNANWDVRMAVHVRPQTHANVLLVGVEITVIRLCVHLNAKMGATALVPIHVNADLAGREITVNYRCVYLDV
jgi:hypothetical protein